MAGVEKKVETLLQSHYQENAITCAAVENPERSVMEPIDFSPFLNFASRAFLWDCPFINALFPFVAILIGALIGAWVVQIMLANKDGEI